MLGVRALRVLPGPESVAAGVDHEVGGRRDVAEDGRVAGVDAGGVQRRVGVARRPLAVGRHGDALPVCGRTAVPVLVAAVGEGARVTWAARHVGRDHARVGDALRNPRAEGDLVGRELVVGRVEVEPVRPLHAGLEQPVGDLADVEPGGAGAVEVDRHLGPGLERVHRVVELQVPLGRRRRRVKFGRLAPLGVAVQRGVVRDDSDAVRLQDHGRGPVADAGGEAVDPRPVGRGVGRPARRVLRAVAEGQVVGHQDGHPSGLGGGGHDRVDLLAHLLGSALGEPGGGRDAAEQLGVGPGLPGEALGGLQGGAERVGEQGGPDQPGALGRFRCGRRLARFGGRAGRAHGQGSHGKSCCREHGEDAGTGKSCGHEASKGGVILDCRRLPRRRKGHRKPHESASITLGTRIPYLGQGVNGSVHQLVLPAHGLEAGASVWRAARSA